MRVQQYHICHFLVIVISRLLLIFRYPGFAYSLDRLIRFFLTRHKTLLLEPLNFELIYQFANINVFYNILLNFRRWCFYHFLRIVR